MLPQGTATPSLAVPLPARRGPPWTLMMTWMPPGQGWSSWLHLRACWKPCPSRGCRARAVRGHRPQSSGPRPRFTVEDLDGTTPPGSAQGQMTGVWQVLPLWLPRAQRALGSV